MNNCEIIFVSDLLLINRVNLNLGLSKDFKFSYQQLFTTGTFGY